MSNNILEKLDSETRDVINYLKSRDEICDVNIEDVGAVTNSQLTDWENRNLCSLPQDLKLFYSNLNGLFIDWKFKIDENTKIPLGKIQINGLKDLTKIGSVLNKDYREPSIFDLEDIQTPPNLAQIASNSFSHINVTNINTNNTTSKITHKSSENDQNDDYIDSKLGESFINLTDDDNDESEVFDKTKDENHPNQTKILLPHFDDTSRNFELDNCNGFGKVCLVYRNTKPGMMISEQSAEIWYLDRSLQWHYLTSSFKNYYRLSISHLGLPQWQMLFTDDGLPPFLNQWYYLFAPGRLMIHQENWKKLEFLSLLENTTSNNNKKPTPQPVNNLNKKIDFAKLFEDKQTKNKNNSSQSANQNGSNQPNNNASDKNANNNSKSKARVNVNVKK